MTNVLRATGVVSVLISLVALAIPMLASLVLVRGGSLPSLGTDAVALLGLSLATCSAIVSGAAAVIARIRYRRTTIRTPALVTIALFLALGCLVGFAIAALTIPWLS